MKSEEREPRNFRKAAIARVSSRLVRMPLCRTATYRGIMNSFPQEQRPADDVCAPASEPAPGSARTVTEEQVADAIEQLRERQSHSAASQIQAVLGAFDIVVVANPSTSIGPPDDQMLPGPCMACLASVSGSKRPGNHTCW